MNAIQMMIAKAAQAAQAKATTVATEAQARKEATKVALEKELESMKAEWTIGVEESTPRKSNLLEKEGKLESVVARISDKLYSYESQIEAKVASLDLISAYVQSANDAKRDLGTAINASAWAIVKAQLEAKGFKLDSRPAMEMKQTLMDRAIETTPEIMELVTMKDIISKRADKVTKARMQVEKDLYYAVKGLQLQIVKLDTLDLEVRIGSPLVTMALLEAPIYGEYRFDFSKKFELFSGTVKGIKDKIRASKVAKSAKEKSEAASEVEAVEVQMQEMNKRNIISLADAKELKALAEASSKSHNTKILTQKTFENARKAAKK